MADGANMAGVTVATAVQQCMAAERWADAASLLAALPELPLAQAFQLNVCRNLAAMQRHRPVLYQTIVTGGGASRYTVGTARTGHPTILYRSDDGSLVSLSPGNEPIAALSSTFASIKTQYQAGEPMAILGIGDGYLIKSCSLHPPALPFDRQQAVYLFEPDVHAVISCLTIHDYSGPTGPIEQERFHWFVGDACERSAREALIVDTYNAPPSFQVSQSPRAAEIGQSLRQVLDNLFALYRQRLADVWRHYASVTRHDLAAVFSARPPRTPRVLLITTRNSSVLQYSTRDAAEGFAANGWEARVFIEPKPSQVVTASRLMELLLEFKPDLVFQIDHLRSEWRDSYPPQLPFACWVQDHLPNLTNPQAGASVGLRDFILLAMPAMYVERYGYPRRQCVELSKLTRAVPLPATWGSDGDDLVYVSSASQLPADILGQIGNQFGMDGALRQVVTAAGEQIIRAYADGRSLATTHAVSVVLADVETQSGIHITNAALRQEVTDALFDRLNNALYRQQGLRWAINIARRLGLSLSIYGPGWDKHPDFAPFARGKIQYGPDLEALTRRTRLNLVLEPFFSVSHQRLLDGLAAGGFFLVRDHPSNTLYQELLNFLAWHPDIEAKSVDGVRTALTGDTRNQFDDLLRRCEPLTGFGDLVNLVRGAERSGVLVPRDESLPHLADVSFASETEMERLIVEHLADATRRRDIAAAQRHDVESRLSYAAGMWRVIDAIGRRIASEDAAAEARAA